MTKEDLIKAAKEARVALDLTLQVLKRDVEVLKNAAPDQMENKNEAIASHMLSIRHVEDGIMRLGMVLKNIGNPTPYPESYNPASPEVAPTADGLKL